MKRSILFAVLAFSLALLLPWFVYRRMIPPPEEASSASSEPEDEVSADRRDADILLTVLSDGVPSEMTMAEYLPGVLAGEMPADFPEEAQRAQAVAARTYALYQQSHRKSAHADADLCDDPACCQVWLDTDEAEARWGEKSDLFASAAADTDGLILLYEEEPILACFHASSDEHTESSAALWGKAYPYLVSVDSPETEADVPNFRSTVEVSPEDFREVMMAAVPDADFSALPPDWLGERTEDTAGRVTSMRIGGTSVSGTQLRSLFSLRSADFTLEWTGHSFLFTVMGSGHGVGMSQYGAEVMAREGATWREIVEHYYPGAEIGYYS